MQTAIINAKILSMDRERREWENGYLLIEGEYIVALGAMTEFKTPLSDNCVLLDAEGGIVMPGMINLHTHLPMIPFRGLGDDCADRLRRFLLPMESQWMSRELVYQAARYAVCESLLNGVTCVVDMYYFEDAVMQAADELGIRGFFGETLMSAPTCDAQSPEQALALSRKLLERSRSGDRVRACVAPHSTCTVDEETLRAAGALAAEFQVPFTLHVAEMDYEMKQFAAAGETPISFLKRLGLLNERLLAAHCIHLNEADIQLVAESGARVAHCVGSNTKAAKGLAPLRGLRAAGVAVGLGTDGPASGNTLDILTQLKLAANFHKNASGDRTAWSCAELLPLISTDAAAAIGMERHIGSLEPGKQADLVILETRSANMFPIYELGSAVVYSAQAGNVDTVFVAGRMLVHRGRLCEADLPQERAALRALLTKTAFKPWS